MVIRITSSKNCIIDNNTINNNNWVNTSTLIDDVYTYNDSYIFCATSCTITNNICRGGLSGSDPSGIIVSGEQNIVTNNRIYKNDSDFGDGAYISFKEENGTSAKLNESRGIISNNFFDSPFCDLAETNSNTIVVGNETNKIHWTIDRNINQTNTVVVPFTENKYYLELDTSSLPLAAFDTFVRNLPAKDGGNKSYTLWIHESRTDTSFANRIGCQSSLDKFVPIGAKITKIAFGVRVISEIPLRNGSFYVYLNKYNKGKTTVTSYDSSLFMDDIDPVDVSGGFNYPISVSSTENDYNIINDDTYDPIAANVINAGISDSTIIGELDLTDFLGNDISSDYVVGLGNPISISLSANFQRDGGDLTKKVDIFISPVAISYRW